MKVTITLLSSGPDWKLFNSTDSIAFLHNHDNNRGSGIGGADVLTQKDGALFTVIIGGHCTGVTVPQGGGGSVRVKYEPDNPRETLNLPCRPVLVPSLSSFISFDQLLASSDPNSF